MTTQMLAWHYTTGRKFKAIAETGALLPTAVGVTSKKERPILWFSLEQFWEPTASKAEMQNGAMVDLKMEGTYRRGGGLARFGVSPTKLVPWPRLALKANIPPRVRVSLEQVAREEGSEPQRWLGLINRPLLLQDVEAIEIFDGEKWARIENAARPIS